jgi:hypothetical protein
MDNNSLGILAMAVGVILLLSGLASYRLLRDGHSGTHALVAWAVLSGPGAVALLTGFFIASFEPD